MPVSGWYIATLQYPGPLSSPMPFIATGEVVFLFLCGLRQLTLVTRESHLPTNKYQKPS